MELEVNNNSKSKETHPAPPLTSSEVSEEQISGPIKHKFELEKHVSYFDKCLFMLPHQYKASDTNRMTFAYFGLSALDLLGRMDEIVTEDQKQSYIQWVYAQQVLPAKNDNSEGAFKYCGFRGSPYSGVPFNPDMQECDEAEFYDRSNLAMTYTALLILILLKDDFSRLNRKAILGALSHLQRPNGSFIPVYGSQESDLRFTFCAFAVCRLLNDWSHINVEKAISYVISSQTFDNAISQGPGQESHGGSTYCGLAALSLADRLDALSDREATLKWCLGRQLLGFHGRLNKLDDTCYSFWIGASIDMLGGVALINQDLNEKFLLSAQTKVGGLSKYPGHFPDLLHSYLGIAGMAIMGKHNLKPLHPSLNISFEALTHWESNILPYLPSSK